MTPIRKCIIPAAGFWTRFLPATKAQPKEMLPIIDTPVIQLLVEEAVSAGITDIMIVISRGKESIQNHFDTSFELERILESKGKTKELEKIKKISTLANITYTRQPIPLGDGDALLRAMEWTNNEPCLILFWDDLVYGEKGSATQLVEAFKKYHTPIIAVEKVGDEKVNSYGIVESRSTHGKTHEVAWFLEKPEPSETPSRLGVIGKYIITPEVFEFLKQDSGIKTSKDGEIRLADAFARMLVNNKTIHALEIDGIRYDTWDKFGFIQATIDYALRDPALQEKVYEFIESRLIKKSS